MEEETTNDSNGDKLVDTDTPTVVLTKNPKSAVRGVAEKKPRTAATNLLSDLHVGAHTNT